MSYKGIDMSVEEYLNQPFKIGGDGEKWLLKDELPPLNRNTRKWLEKELKKGNRPDFNEIYRKVIGG